MLLKNFLFLMLMLRAIHGSKNDNVNKESFYSNVPEEANICHDVSKNIREKRGEYELNVKSEMLSANENARQKFKPIWGVHVVNEMSQRNMVDEFLETVERKQESLRLIDENEEALKFLLEEKELELFKVSDDNGFFTYQFDDLGFRMIVRNVQDIDDSGSSFQSTFTVDLSWFDFYAFDEFWTDWNANGNEKYDLKFDFSTKNKNSFTKRTTRITANLREGRTTDEEIEAVFGRDLPKLSFRKLKGEQPDSKLIQLKMHVIMSEDGKVVKGYFTMRVRYTSVQFTQVVEDKNIPWDWQKFEYKFSSELQGSSGEAELVQFWTPKKNGFIKTKYNHFDKALMILPAAKPDLEHDPVSGYYNKIDPSKRTKKTEKVKNQRAACKQSNFMMIDSHMLREWDLYGYACDKMQGQLKFYYKPNGKDDDCYVRFYAKRQPAQALESIREISSYSYVASFMWLMEQFVSWDLAANLVNFVVMVLFVMAPLQPYRAEFKHTYVKKYFGFQKLFIVLEGALQIVGRSPIFGCEEEGKLGEWNCLKPSHMWTFFVISLGLKVFSSFLFSAASTKHINFSHGPEDPHVYFKTDREKFESKCDLYLK